MSYAIHSKVLKMFNGMVVGQNRHLDAPTTAGLCVAINFVPTKHQLQVLKDNFSPIPIKTLFTVEERKNSDPINLFFKQLLHYVEVYGLNQPGLFNLEMTNGQVLTMNYVRALSIPELKAMVLDLLYSNAPILNTDDLIDIVKYYKIDVDLNSVQNNEARVLLYDNLGGIFGNGDDAVRYLCYKATDNAMLIKDDKTVQAINEFMTKQSSKEKMHTFFEKHAYVLSQVFNRHKKLIISAKNSYTANVINKIARMSKKNHVPIQEHISKRFISEALKGEATRSTLKHVTVRDKLKYLNVLADKAVLTEDLYVIRNGKIFVKDSGRVSKDAKITKVVNMVLKSLADDLEHLKGQKILLDENVDYGLPTSRKQTVGYLPFNTRVGVDTDFISAGIYWQNDWGARDLDLSTIDAEGNRTGWGDYSGYNNNNPITFSGDIVDARNGAMEFMTSKGVVYGIFANIYAGETDCGMELVVGNKKGKWIKDTIIREKMNLPSRGMVLGFVNNNEFIVYSGRVSNVHTSSGVTATTVFAKKALVDAWTVSKLLDALNIDYDLDRNDAVEYDHKLEYNAISYDKLEALFGI